MQIAILATNGGPHPADRWAAFAAEKIANLIQIDEQSTSELAITARKAKPRFVLAMADAIEPLFDIVARNEQQGVELNHVTLRNAPFDVSDVVDDAAMAIGSLAADTPFAAHFKTDACREAVNQILHQIFLDAANIARSWAFDQKGL